MLNKIQNDIKSTFYVQNFPNGGQRFVAWYLKNIYHLSDIQVKDSVTDSYMLFLHYLHGKMDTVMFHLLQNAMNKLLRTI